MLPPMMEKKNHIFFPFYFYDITKKPYTESFFYHPFLLLKPQDIKYFLPMVRVKRYTVFYTAEVPIYIWKYISPHFQIHTAHVHT